MALVGVEKEPTKLFVKILLVMDYFACASYRIGAKTCGSEIFKLRGTCQGNLALGTICCDASCLLKKIEEMKLGIVV